MKLVLLVAVALAFTSSAAFADWGGSRNRGDSWDHRGSGGFDRGSRYHDRGHRSSQWSVSWGLSTTGLHHAPFHHQTWARCHSSRTIIVREPVVVIREPTVIVRDPVIVREAFCGPTAIVTERVVVREPVFVAPRSFARVEYRSLPQTHRSGWSFSGRVVYRH